MVIISRTFSEGVIKDTPFKIIAGDMTYNIIMGRLWMHAMEAIPSIQHPVITFPSKWEIIKIKGEQRMARECYYPSPILRADTTLDTNLT